MSLESNMMSSDISQKKSQIVLCTLNSTYQHSAFGLRYILANMGDLQSQTQIFETTIDQKAEKICSSLIALNPAIIGFGIYIWNIDQTLNVIKQLRQINPLVKIIVGGPEVSYEIENQEIRDWVDFVVTGEADFSFKETCESVLSLSDPCEEISAWPKTKFAQIIRSPLPEIKQIITPYDLYTDEDIKNRLIYVEASRGCPYKCEYCLSSLDKSVRSFELDQFLSSLQTLIDRGARNFKFIDRTFNLNMTVSQKIINFFLKHVDLGLFLHFEMVPDRLPEELRALFKLFPAGAVQFEVGIQTLNPIVAKNISRNNDLKKVVENFRFLAEETQIHTHADLIVGLPGETLESFGQGFDLLHSWRPHEIQVGLLKRLKGTPIARHEASFSMIYSKKSPFTILSTKDISADDVLRMEKFSRYWDQLFNHGEFPQTAKLIESLGPSLFSTFLELSDWLFNEFGRAYAIRMESWIPVLGKFFAMKNVEEAKYIECLAKDYYRKPNRNRLPLLEPFDSIRRSHQGPRKAGSSLTKRQQSHSL